MMAIYTKFGNEVELRNAKYDENEQQWYVQYRTYDKGWWYSKDHMPLSNFKADGGLAELLEAVRVADLPAPMYDEPAGTDEIPHGYNLPPGWHSKVNATLQDAKNRPEGMGLTDFINGRKRVYIARNLEDPVNYPLGNSQPVKRHPRQDAIDELRDVQDDLRDIVERLRGISRGLPNRERIDRYITATIECATTSEHDWLDSSYNLDKAIAELEGEDNEA